VAVRWGHIAIVDYLLSKVQWTKDEIMMAFEEVKSEEIKTCPCKFLLVKYST